MLQDKIKREIERAGARDDWAARERIREYVTAFEHGAPLELPGLNSEYRLISEHGNHILAGYAYSGNEAAYGYQFATWQYAFDRNGAELGHYYPTWSPEINTLAYEMAKEDFAVRSGLVREDKIFDSEQLRDIHIAVKRFADEAPDLTYEDCERLRELIEQIERLRPELLIPPEPEQNGMHLNF